MLRRACGAEEAGSSRVRWRDRGSGPGRTENMPYMLVTCATSQSRGWLKLEAYCQVRRGGGEECSVVRGVQRRRAAGKAVARRGSSPGVP